MKIVLTGASGFVGRQLVPLLEQGGARLLLVGRDPEKLRRLFPGREACGYRDLAGRAPAFDQLVHMAAVNSGAGLSLDETRKVNVSLLEAVVASARQAGIPRVINLSSTHALHENPASAYARTKREAAERLRALSGLRAVTVFLPPVHGQGWSGRLAVLNPLPRWLAVPLFTVAAALTPTVSVERLAAFLLAPAEADAELVLSDGQEHNPVYRLAKRSLDLGFAIGVVALLWWLLALVWVLVRLGSPGPGLFAQQRVGRSGRPFACYKFRSMKSGTIQAATNEVPASAVTRTGQFLRRTKLDELPQVWNILRNEISLVGPRPCLPVQTNVTQARARRGVLVLKPGMTGLAQISGVDMSDPERLARHDAQYLALQSLLLDAKIILATAMGEGQGDHLRRDNWPAP